MRAQDSSSADCAVDRKRLGTDGFRNEPGSDALTIFNDQLDAGGDFTVAGGESAITSLDGRLPC
jgi:hypothetical protein